VPVVVIDSKLADLGDASETSAKVIF